MRRWGVLLAAVVLVSLTGCASAPPEQEMKQLQRENARLQAENATLQAQLDAVPDWAEEVTVQVGGDIMAAVYDVIPDPSFDGHIPMVALAAPFQSSPVLLHFYGNSELAAELQASLEKGEVYVLEFAAAELTMTRGRYEMLRNMGASEQQALLRHPPSGFRLAKEEEWGLAGPENAYAVRIINTPEEK